MWVGMLVDLSAEDNDRVGNCWMKGRLRDGDLAMVTAHSGDCFWDLVLVEQHATNAAGEPLYHVIEGSRLGAYVCGRAHKVQPTARQVHLLLAGEYVPFPGAQS